MLEDSSAKVLMQDHHCHAEFIKDIAWWGDGRAAGEWVLCSTCASSSTRREDAGRRSGAASRLFARGSSMGTAC